jgi:predicted  nucleic acid-binding Zn-ribbon protein
MRTSVSLDDELASYVDETSSSAGENNAEAIRETLRHARDQADRVDDLEAETDRLQERVDELEAELDRVKNEKRLLLEEREEKKELVRYAEDQRTRAERKDSAPIWTRAKWKVLGMPSDETSA